FLFTCILMWVSHSVTAQSAPVYSWVGGSSGNWHNSDNWIVNGEVAVSYPTRNDRVFISSENPVSIQLDENAFAEAITTTGNGKITLTARRNVALEINGSIILSENTYLDSGIEIAVKGREGYFAFPELLSDRINFKSKKGYTSLKDNARSLT